MTALGALGQALREALFYVLVAGWWLVCVQWDVVDRMLGGPDLNARHSGSRREREVEAAGLEAALSWSAGRKPQGTAAPADAPPPPPEVMAARATAQVDAGTEKACGGGNAAATSGVPDTALAEASDEAAALPDTPQAQGKRAALLSRFSSRSLAPSELDESAGRTLYGRLRGKLPTKDRFNVKQRLENRIAAYGVQLLPEFAASIGVEAAAGTLAAALPGGIRDAGVRMVDRVEAALRRWAVFLGGTAVLFRVLLWH